MLLSGLTQVLKAQETYPLNDVANPKKDCYTFTNAFIQGRQIDLNNKQKQLAEKYETKYGIK